MLGSATPIKFTKTKCNLEQKYRTVRNHFICEFILEYSGYDSIHEFLRGTIVEYDKVIFPPCKRGSIANAVRKFQVSKETVEKVWERCLKQEWKKDTIYNRNHLELVCGQN